MKRLYYLLIFLLTIIGYNAQTYCTPITLEGCLYGDEITDFSIPSASFSHSATGCSINAYGDFTSQTITLQAGVNYDYSIVVGYDTHFTRIWIDYNNDGTFTDAAPELINQGSSGSGSNINGVLLVDSNVPTGNYRMRVATSYNQQPTPCNLNNYGEAHDYTVAVTQALGTSEVITKESVNVHPNPFTDVINIPDTKDLKSISVVDMSGRIVRRIDNPRSQINLGELSSGMYILTLHYNDESIKTVKVIKK